MNKLWPLLLVMGCLAAAACAQEAPGVSATNKMTTIDHSAFSAILQQHVDDQGMVDYAAITADTGPLDEYLASLDATDPSGLTEPERLAYWINVYNAYTLKLIANKYPVSSIKKTNGLFIPGIRTPWHVDIVKAGGDVFSLDHVEHKIIRAEFEEPRIHFALVCAAISCPPLRREAFVADRLDEQLTEQAQRFLTDSDKNQFSLEDGEIKLSKIFDWFKADFLKGSNSLEEYVSEFLDPELSEALLSTEVKVRFLKYDWSLNDQARVMP